VTCLGDPPPCLPVGVAGLEVYLFSAGADVRLKPLLEHELADVGVVVAAVKAQPLGCSAVGIGRAIGTDSSVSVKSFLS
jgi:hypothetical protein